MCYVLYKMYSTDSLHEKFSLFKEVNQHWARLVHGLMTIPVIFFASYNIIGQWGSLCPEHAYVSPSCEMEFL